MTKVGDIAGGFFNNETIYSPNGFTQARKVSNAIVDRNISDMQNEIQQGENIGAEARKDKKEDDKSSISKTVVSGSSLPSKKDLAAKGKADKKAFSTSLKDSKDFAYKKADDLIAQADELENEATNTEDEDEKKYLLKQAKSLRVEAERTRKDADTTYSKSIKKETLVNPDNASSGATATPVDNSTPGTKEDPNAKYGRKADEPAPTAGLPMARAGLFEDKQNAEQALADKRKARDDFINAAKQDKKSAKRDIRSKSIIPDDFDFEDEFDSTDPFVASLFSKGKINKLLKDQIKEQYPDQIAEIVDSIKNDPNNDELSGKEKRKLINKAVTEFIKPLWEKEGGNEQVNRVRLSTPFATVISKIVSGDNVPESVKKVMNDKRAALEKKQNRSLKDQMFLDAFNMIEKDIEAQNKTTELKGEVKTARSNLTNINKEVKQHQDAVDAARREFAGTDRKTRVERKDGFDFFYTSGEGSATQYAARTETKDGEKKYVVYSVTGDSPDTDLDPVAVFDYKEYSGENNPNIINVMNFAEMNLGQVRGGRKGLIAKGVAEQKAKDFEALDGQNYFDYSKAHKVMAPKILKLILDLGGKIDVNTGKIYSVSKDDFPEGADQLFLDYGTAQKLVGYSVEDLSRLTGMSQDEVRAIHEGGMTRNFKLGDAHVTQDDQGRLIYALPADNKTVLSGAGGRGFYINWNNPENRRVVEKYAKLGKTKQDIPLSELKTVNTSRSTEGNIDWTDTKKTKATEKNQRAKYTGSYKPTADVLDALIGFGRKR